MSNLNGSKKLNEYINEIEGEVKTLYDEEKDMNELDYLLKQIDFIKLDDDTDFHKSFINQIMYFIKSDGNKTFFDFKIKKNSNILDFIINYAAKFKAINKIDNKNKEKKNEENLKKSKNIRTKNKKSSEQNNSTIDNNSSESNSSSYFSINKSNLIDINKSLEKNMENVKTEENIIKKNVKENMIFIHKNFKFEEYETKIIGIEKEKEKKIKSINYYEDDSEIKGNSFEYDSIYYIFQKIYSIATNKDFSIIYNIEPNINKINSIFKSYKKLYELNKIQFDFIIINLKISDLIEFLIDNYSVIHSNSKLRFVSKDKKFFTLEDLNLLKEEKKILRKSLIL